MSMIKSACLMSLLLLSNYTWGSKVTLMVEQYPPYIQSEAANQGFVTELVSEAFAKAKVKTQVQFGSWLDVEDAIDNKRVLSYMWTLSKPRFKKWHYSDPIYHQQLTFLAREDFNIDINHLHNLRRVKLGLSEGVDYGDIIEGYRNKIKVTSFVSDFALLAALLDSKVDLVIIEPAVASSLLKNQFGNRLKRRLKAINTSHFPTIPFYLVCSKNYGNCLSHIKKFNKGLAQMKADGSSATLINSAEKI